MAMAVHHDSASREPLQPAHQPVAVDEGGSDALGQGLGGAGIFDEMVMQRDDPARVRIMGDGDVHGARLFRRDQSQRVGEGKMGIGVRVQQDHSEPVVAVGNAHQRKDPGP